MFGHIRLSYVAEKAFTVIHLQKVYWNALLSVETEFAIIEFAQFAVTEIGFTEFASLAFSEFAFEFAGTEFSFNKLVSLNQF